jgi:predicted ATPase
VTIGGDIPRAIVARLALDAGEVVATESLVTDIWSQPTDRIVLSLRAHVSRLRHGPLAEVVEGGRQGYRLLVDPDDVDAQVLTSAVGAVDDDLPPTERALRLERAVGLWRGQPLADLPALPFVEEWRTRLLEQLRLGALALAHLRLDNGEVALALAGLERMVAERPLDEEPTLLLATAMARAGRASEALTTLDDHRRRLRDEQGLDPSPEAMALRAGIVRQDPEVLGLDIDPDADRSNVPIPLTAFVGRGEELAHLDRARAASRLVTLVGPAGVGKTRLLVEHARRSADAARRCFVDLSTVETGDVAHAVAAIVGAPASTVPSIATRVSGNRVLLILDNAEHVLADVRDLAGALLSAADDLEIAVTSREPLGIAGERLVRVEPFDGERMRDAVALFVQRAEDADDAFRGDETTTGIVEEICRLVDGLPLAVELAAGRLDVLPLTALRDSLADAAPAPPGPPPTGTDRHASLDQAIGWSTALLDDAERALLGQLGLFAGPFTLDAVEGVCIVEGDPIVVTLELVRKSLVAVSGDDAGGRRYRVLRSIRQHVRRDFPVDADQWYDRHARWMAAFAGTTAERLSSPDARAAQTDLDATRADLGLALDTAVRRGERRLSLELFVTLASYWYRRGQVDDALDAAARADGVRGTADPALEARFRRARALVAYRAGDAAAIERFTNEALELARRSGDRPLEAVTLANHAYTSTLFGDVDAGDEMMRRALELGVGAPPAIQSEIALCHGQLMRTVGRPQDALRALARAQHLSAANGPGWIQAFAPYMTAKVLLDLRRGRDAIAVLLPGLAHALATDDPTSALIMLHAVAASSAHLERHEVGATLFGMIDAMGVRYGYDTGASEGADAEEQRRRVREGLTGPAFDEAYRRGRGMGFGQARALAESLTT